MNITLIGMSGVGKTTIGKALANKLECTFIDPDDIIRALGKAELQELLEKLGDRGYLKL